MAPQMKIHMLQREKGRVGGWRGEGGRLLAGLGAPTVSPSLPV